MLLSCIVYAIPIKISLRVLRHTILFLIRGVSSGRGGGGGRGEVHFGCSSTPFVTNLLKLSPEYEVFRELQHAAMSHRV